uniref:Putative ovule protein n=1 Tax=Solanum chacoense TaxID=4108 RepID=A0A0V0GQG2_SOLCH
MLERLRNDRYFLISPITQLSLLDFSFLQTCESFYVFDYWFDDSLFCLLVMGFLALICVRKENVGGFCDFFLGFFSWIK